MDYIPFKRLLPNKFFMLSSVLAHNITHEMQMIISPKMQSTSFKRAALWSFQKIDTIRKNIFIRAGIITKPQGRLTLTISAGKKIADEFKTLFEALKMAV